MFAIVLIVTFKVYSGEIARIQSQYEIAAIHIAANTYTNTSTN